MLAIGSSSPTRISKIREHFCRSNKSLSLAKIAIRRLPPFMRLCVLIRLYWGITSVGEFSSMNHSYSSRSGLYVKHFDDLFFSSPFSFSLSFFLEKNRKYLALWSFCLCAEKTSQPVFMIRNEDGKKRNVCMIFGVKTNVPVCRKECLEKQYFSRYAFRKWMNRNR